MEGHRRRVVRTLLSMRSTDPPMSRLTMSRLSRFAAMALLALESCLMLRAACADEFDAAREVVRQHLVENRIPGMSVAVWRDGRIIWEQGFGWADLEHRIAATEHTAFDVASVTKTLTAVALMRLVQDGRVELDRPANQYLGENALRSRGADAGSITLRHLANHTSGLQGGDQFFFGDSATQAPSTDQAIARYGFAFAETGKRYRYSNLGYGVLGQVIAQVSGRSYEDFLREEIFLPLGMNRSSVHPADEMRPYAATRYDMDRRPISFGRSVLPAAGSVYASVHDMARFGLFLSKQRLADQVPILSDASIDAMLRNRVSTGKPGVDYGIGLVEERLGGYDLVGHTGSSSGASAYFAMIPARNLGVMLLANVHGGASEKLLSKVLQKFLPDWQEARSPAKPPVAVAGFQPTPRLIGAWQGVVHTYEGDLPIRLQVFPSRDVHVRIGKPRFPWMEVEDALLNHVRFVDAELTGTTLAQIDTSDTKRYPHTVSLSLILRGNVLSGQATAVSRFDGVWIYALPYWTELHKIDAD